MLDELHEVSSNRRRFNPRAPESTAPPEHPFATLEPWMGTIRLPATGLEYVWTQASLHVLA
jgi:hypothetical protein